uniref:Dof zinc finger protein n=1 Tax=Aegilops tauschii TaxID=37682 RepID=M8CGW7_AEGTA
MGQLRPAAGGGGDCLIKLFGKTIPVPDAGAGANAGDVDKDLGNFGRFTEPMGKKDLQHRGGSTTAELKVQEIAPQDSTGSPQQPEVVDVEDPSAAKNSVADQQDEEQGDTANQKEKLKKPDKILPCPRCSSMDTKFCYYNNYNINQPRHFCKNCQRYWTAGGAMRNVPVGAGRRKSKSLSAASHFLQRIRAALPGDPLCTPVNTNGTVLSFGSDASTLDVSEQMKHIKELASVTRTENTDAPSVGSSAEGCFQSRKHPRDGDEERDTKGNGKVWVPKTIRIDDVDEVARSSIWSLIGIKGDKVEKDDGKGCKLARVFDPKDEAKTSSHRGNNSLPFLKGNPAALSRSVNFQERS